MADGKHADVSGDVQRRLESLSPKGAPASLRNQTLASLASETPPPPAVALPAPALLPSRTSVPTLSNLALVGLLILAPASWGFVHARHNVQMRRALGPTPAEHRISQQLDQLGLAQNSRGRLAIERQLVFLEALGVAELAVASPPHTLVGYVFSENLLREIAND